MKEQITGKVAITRKNNVHKEFVKKGEEIEKAKLPEGTKKINGRLYNKHDSYVSRGHAERASTDLKSSNFTHIEKVNGKWTLYILPI